MKTIFLFILFLQFLQSVFLYLTNTKWMQINNFLLNKNKCTKEEVDKINKIIYLNYEKWAFYASYKFKQFHFFKCKEISQKELNLYASIGLTKAIQNYNPLKNATFSIYASNYIRGELYNGMSDLQPINSLTKSERKKSIYNRNRDMKIQPHLTSKNDYLFVANTKYDSNSYKKNEELWKHIFEMDIPLITKNVIKLKYSFDFIKIRTNKQISLLLCCSEENVRLNINLFKKKLLVDLDSF